VSEISDSMKAFTLDTLEALTFWDVKIVSAKGMNLTLSLHDPQTGAQVASFTGSMADVVAEADAWFDGVEFTFPPIDEQEVQP
jgi:hypothetical protein